jgi:ATP-binding cassette subfamily B protein IrtA
MNKQQGTFAKLMTFANDCKSKMILSVIFAVIGVLLGMLPYLCIAVLLTYFYNHTATLFSVLLWSLIAVVAQIIKMYLTTVSSMKSHEAAFTILKNIRTKLTDKMEHVPMGVMLDTPSGEFKSLVVDTVDRIEKPLAHMIPEMTANILTPIVIFVAMFWVDWRLALAVLVVVPIGFIVFIGQMIGYKEKSKRFYQAEASMNNAIVEYVGGIEVIKAFNRSASSYGKFIQAVKYYRDFTLSWWRNCWVYSAIGVTILSSTLIVVLPYGAYLFMNANIEFAPFITCVVLSLGIAGPIIALLQYSDNFALVFQCIKQITSFLETDELIRPKKRIALDKSMFEFRNVCFGYKEKEILHNISFKTEPSAMMAIVGPSGGGKSTIAKLMAGFWDPTSGDIFFGGKNIKEIPFEQLMENISYVAQDSFLFNDTIMENIRAGRKNASDGEVYAAATAAGCDEFIKMLDNGYQTIVGDAGGKLSGGERQRITIARAILKNANVIILDEATAYADPENEADIQLAIGKLVKGKTLIVIAHRLSTIKNAEKIVVIENGKIVHEGRHEELLEECPLYKKMWVNHMSTMDD